MSKYNLTTEDYENLAADTKAALLRYIEGDGDSDQYDTEEETEMVKNLTEEEKKLYDEYRDVYIKQLVEMGRVADLSAEIRRHMFKWLPGIPAEYTEIASQAVKKAREERKKKVTIEKKNQENFRGRRIRDQIYQRRSEVKRANNGEDRG